jgi:hypothetical protein
MEISIKHDLHKITKHLNDLQKQVVPQAAARALTRTADQVMTAAAKSISAETGIKQSTVKKHLIRIKAHRNKLQAEVVAKKYAPNLAEFMSGTQISQSLDRKGKGVKAKAWGKRKEYPHTFIGRGKNSGKMLVFARTSDKRTARLKTIYGPSIPQTFIQRHVHDALVKLAHERWQVNFDADLKFYLSRL